MTIKGNSVHKSIKQGLVVSSLLVSVIAVAVGVRVVTNPKQEIKESQAACLSTGYCSTLVCPPAGSTCSSLKCEYTDASNRYS